MIALSLAKAGYYNGNPEQVLEGRIDIVLQLFYFEDFCNKYQITEIELNKEN